MCILFEWTWLNRLIEVLTRENVENTVLEYSRNTKWTNFLLFHIYPTPPLGQDMTLGHFLKRSLTGLNSEFSFS